MTMSIKVALEQSSGVEINTALIREVHLYERGIVNANEDHIAFFGGNLMGVHPMRFKTSDRETWLNDIVKMDEIDIEDLLRQVKSLDPNWVRANDVMNLSCLWLAHRFYTDTKLTTAQREQGAVSALLVMQYKFLGSLMAHYFPYPADEATMQAAYAELSRKYALKAAGSWSALLEQRAKEILSSRSVHAKVIQDFSSDTGIIYAVGDIQGRLREMVKSMCAVFYRVKELGSKIRTDKASFDVDGELITRDKSRHYTSLINYLNDVVDDKASFIKPELIDLVGDAMHTMSPKLLQQTLEWVSINYRVKGHENLEELVKETLLFAFDLISSDRTLYAKNSGLTPLITKLRSLYMASRMSDTTLLNTKDISEWVVSQSINTKNASVVASVRTGLQLYIVIRALAKNYYQN
jgi:hypothetical protein